MHIQNKTIFILCLQILTVTLNGSQPQQDKRLQHIQQLLKRESSELIPYLQNNNDLLDADLGGGRGIGHQLLFQKRFETFSQWLDLQPQCTNTTLPDDYKKFPGGCSILHAFLFQVAKEKPSHNNGIEYFRKIIRLNPALINQQRDDGTTPAHIATQRNIHYLLEELIKNGADLTVNATFFGKTKTPLEILQESKKDKEFAKKIQDLSKSQTASCQQRLLPKPLDKDILQDAFESHITHVTAAYLEKQRKKVSAAQPIQQNTNQLAQASASSPSKISKDESLKDRTEKLYTTKYFT